MALIILFVQTNFWSKTHEYNEYNSVVECLEGVRDMYEEYLKHTNPNKSTITYDINELFDFLDQLPDIGCLVYKTSTRTYIPYNKEWIKNKIYTLQTFADSTTY
uniref:Enhancer of rudimentary homolog n=1 Tax=Glossina brevipalpis TaxID=37001 RepID=A0A1A9VZL7_9MUSC